VFSPASVSLALGMTYGGAGGDTATETAHTLHLDALGKDAHADLHALSARLTKAAGKAELRIANRLYLDKQYSLAKPYATLVQKQYGATVEHVDFAKQHEKARTTINDWVAKQTADRIKDLIPEGAVDSTTALVLVNAIYFKGTWKTRFDPKATADAAFTTAAGDSVQVPTMNEEITARYATTGGVEILELPYVKSDLVMDFVLPTSAPLAKLEERLDQKTLTAWFAALEEPTEIDVSLPKFRAETTLDLGATLQKLGMVKAFSEGADFSAMLAKGSSAVHVSAVLHKAFVQVDEAGAEAAAATAVVMNAEDAAEPEKPSFRADHPFLFVLRDRTTGAILFLGRVDDPR
jgi:serpin B